MRHFKRHSSKSEDNDGEFRKFLDNNQIHFCKTKTIENYGWMVNDCVLYFDFWNHVFFYVETSNQKTEITK